MIPLSTVSIDRFSRSYCYTV